MNMKTWLNFAEIWVELTEQWVSLIIKPVGTQYDKNRTFERPLTFNHFSTHTTPEVHILKHFKQKTKKHSILFIFTKYDK